MKSLLNDIFSNQGTTIYIKPWLNTDCVSYNLWFDALFNICQT